MKGIFTILLVALSVHCTFAAGSHPQEIHSLSESPFPLIIQITPKGNNSKEIELHIGEYSKGYFLAEISITLPKEKQNKLSEIPTLQPQYNPGWESYLEEGVNKIRINKLKEENPYGKRDFRFTLSDGIFEQASIRLLFTPEGKRQFGYANPVVYFIKLNKIEPVAAGQRR